MRANSLIKPHGLRKLALLSASAAIAAPAIVHMSAYANTLTRLIPDLYAGLDVVSRELVGFIPSVYRNVSAERAAVGQSIVYFITGADSDVFDVTPAMNIPEPVDKTVGNGTITISKSKGVAFGWTGEQQRGLNTGSGYLSVQADLFAQGLRTLVNLIETDLAVEAAANVSRWTGTAGTTPFATNVGPTAQVRKILDDNGAPATGRALVIDTTAGASLRTLSNLTKANEAGTTMVLTDGTLINLNGLNIKESAQAQSIGAGTAAGATTNAAGYAKGATAITFAAAGTGTLPAGTSFTLAGDTNVYTVAQKNADGSAAGLASAAAGGLVTINAPGLRVAIPNAATAATVVAAHTANVAFSPNALHLVARAPALPQEGDIAIDRINITDPRSGMVFEVAIYAGYRKIRAEVTAAWGVKAVKPEHIAGILG
jgi:P22 coat protein - gene protein 5